MISPGGSHGRRKTVGAELHHGINLVKCQAMHAAIETARSNRSACSASASCAQVGARRTDERIEHQHHAALVLAREFADHQAAGFRGDFPVHEAGAIGGLIVAQGMQLVAAPAEMTGHLAAQQRQDFIELLGRLDARIDDDFDVRIHLARLFEEAEGKPRANAESILAVDAAARKSQLHFLARRALPRNVRKKNGRVRISRARPSSSRPTTRSENDGQICFSLRSSISASTGCSAKMCSGKSNFSSIAGEHDAREHAGNQNPREQAGENHEEQIVAGVDRGENQDENGGEINDSVAREAVIDLIGEPAQAGAARQRGNDRDRHPAGQPERDSRG